MSEPNKVSQINTFINAMSQTMSTLRFNVGQILGQSHNGNRNIYRIYGYPDQIQYSDMFQYSRRQGMANRITHGMAKSCWRDGFEAYADSEEDSERILVDELSILKKAGLNNKIERADILNRIGKFSVLFVGIPDGLEPSEPVGRVNSKDLSKVFFKAFGYDGIQIHQQETDPKNPRFGLPKMYSVQKIANGNMQKDSQQESMIVHWSRIVHLNEEALDSDVEGMGQLEPIFNRILDLDKATGGASEAYFRNAKGKIAYEIDKEFADSLLNTTGAKEALEQGAEDFTNQGKDHIFALGAQIKAVDTPHYSPKDTIMGALWEISGYTGIPIRLLIGEGSGQLAGSEDQLSYNALVSARQFSHCGSWVFRVLEILSEAGMIKLDQKNEVRFPHQQPVTEAQAAEISNKKADTIAKVAAAASVMGGDEIDVTGTLEKLGVEIEVDLMPDLDDDIDPDIEPEPE